MWQKFKQLTEWQTIALLAVGCLIAFGQTLFFNFIALDDSRHIWSNNYVNTLSWKHLQFLWETPYYGLYIPMVYSFWSVLAEVTQFFEMTHEVSGYSATLFHLTNLIFHLFNVLMIFQLLSWLSEKMNPSESNSPPSFIALIGTSIYAWHPLQVEPVAWASGLKDLMSSFFALLSILCFIRYAEQFNQSMPSRKKNKKSQTGKYKLIFLKNTFSKNNNWINWLLSLVFFGLGLFCKPSIVVLPAILLLLVVFAYRNTELIRKLMVFFILVVPMVFITKNLQPNSRIEFSIEFWQYPVIALHALGFYVSKFLLPINLGPDYGMSPDVVFSQASFLVYIFVGILTLTLIFWGILKRWTFTSLGFGILLIGLSPVLGFVPFEHQNMSTVADRYFYLFPCLGLAIVVMSGLAHWKFSHSSKFALVIGIALLAASVLQTSHWKNNASLFDQALSVNPRSYLSLNNMGLVYLRKKDYNKAEKYLEQALQVKSNYKAAQTNLGVVYFKQEKYEKVIDFYSQILKKLPKLTAGSSATYADMHYNLGAAYLNTQQLQPALRHLNKAAEININHFQAQFHRGRIYAHLNQLKAAKAAFLQAYRINPKATDVVHELNKLRAQGVSFQ